MTEKLVVIREPAGEPVVEFRYFASDYRVKGHRLEISSGVGWIRERALQDHAFRADRIARGEEPPADGFELKQEQGALKQILRANGELLWLGWPDGSTWTHPECTIDEIIAIADILKGERPS